VGQRAFVVHGQAELPELRLRSGDVLCASDQPGQGALEVFQPLSPGHPMLGREVDGRLHSLPANLPCSAARWSSVGAVCAVLRRGLWDPASLRSGVGPLPEAPACSSADAPLRSLCVRIPSAALALARRDRPEWLGRSLQLRQEPGGSVLVFPGATAGRQSGRAAAVTEGSLPSEPDGWSDPEQLPRLADALAHLLGPGAQVELVSAVELRVSVQRQLSLLHAERLARQLAGQLRLPLCLAVADTAAQARALAAMLQPDQLFFQLPGSPFQVAEAPCTLPGFDLPRRAPRPASVAPAALGRAPRVAAASGRHSPQLSLFDDCEAA